MVSEACLKRWPKAVRAAHKSRLDNVNHCLRSFGVDGSSTRYVEEKQDKPRSGEMLLRSSLQIFTILGDGPFGIIDVPTYRRRLAWLQKRALSDENLIEELVHALIYSPKCAPNGIQLDYMKTNDCSVLFEHIMERSGNGRKLKFKSKLSR